MLILDRRRRSTGINLVCPAITPTFGAEILTNGGFEDPYNTTGTLEIASGWIGNALFDGVDTAAKETTIVSTGSSSQKIIASAQNRGILSSGTPITLGNWFAIGYDLYGNGASSVAVLDSAGSAFVRTHTNPAAAWNSYIATFRGVSGTDRRLVFGAGSGGATWYNDATTVKQLADMTVLLGRHTAINGTYQCTPTVTAYTQAGLYIRYTDADNFVSFYVDRVTSKGVLLKCIAGVYTVVISETITYGAEDILKCIVDGTSYSLYYNGAQVGATQTISDSLGDAVYGFSTYAANTVGTVTVNSNLP